MSESLASSRPVQRLAQTRGPGTAQLLVLLAASCLSVLGAVLIAPVLPQMQAAFATVPGADVLVPVVLTVPALMIGLAAPFAGLIVDRVDRKRLLLIALAVYAVVGTAPLYLASLQAILISRVLVGVCEAAIMTCATTLIGDYWSGARRSRYLGLQTLVASLSATVFLGLGGVLGTLGWRTPFWVYAVAVVLVPLTAVLIRQPAEHGRRPASRRLQPLPWRSLLTPCAVSFVGGIVFYTLIVELSFVLTGVGLTSSAAIGGISALMSVATAAGCVVFARLTHRTPRALLPVEFLLSAIGFGLVFATTSVPVISLGAVFAGFGTGMLLPTLLTWAVNRLDFEQRGRGTGLWTGTLFVGEFVCPVLIAAIGTGVGGLRPAIGVLGVLAAVMAVVCVLVTRRTNVPLDITND
ncbi:MFS transporter [Lentzea sp. NPDC005914]|uniref:MFS transporter n=1 Tax=Lentzea sp. NPDC005914 TaxID=3154572 RepID=UPI0033F577AF